MAGPQPSCAKRQVLGRASRRRRAPALPLAQAAALGLLHGPTELLPVSSSAHVTLIPWLLGWRYGELDAELRKSFEIALHAGTAAALLIGLRAEVGRAMAELDRRRLALILLSFAPPAALGWSLERPIERRLGTPPSIAVGLAVGAVAMAAADRAPRRRRRAQAGWVDGLWLGAAQASALVPGVSRNGATLAAARVRGFQRADANELSRHVAPPIILGAALLKTVRLRRRGLAPDLRSALGVGAGAAFISTLASIRVIRLVERDRALGPYAAYRLALAALVLVRSARSPER